MKLDLAITGEKRQPLVEHYLKGCRVYEGTNGIEGFWLPELGEGPIYSATTEAGISLLEEKTRKNSRIILPIQNLPGIDWLRHKGFNRMPGVRRRMLLGKAPNWQPLGVFCRAGGNIG